MIGELFSMAVGQPCFRKCTTGANTGPFLVCLRMCSADTGECCRSCDNNTNSAGSVDVGAITGRGSLLKASVLAWATVCNVYSNIEICKDHYLICADACGEVDRSNPNIGTCGQL